MEKNPEISKSSTEPSATNREPSATSTETTKQREEGVAARFTPTNMASYNSAVENFSKSVTAFMEQMHHLSQARDAYHEAIRASMEMRKILDAGDETLRTLMGNLEQAIDAHLGRQILDKKKPERLKLESLPASGEHADAAKAAS